MYRLVREKSVGCEHGHGRPGEREVTPGSRTLASTAWTWAALARSASVSEAASSSASCASLACRLD